MAILKNFFTYSVYGLTLVLLLGLYNTVSAQKPSTLKIVFKTVYGKEALVLDSMYKSNSGDSLIFKTLKFYVSGFFLNSGTRTVFKDKNSYYLIDLNKPETQVVELSLKPNHTYTTLHFNLGIDSVTNVSGAMGGDLDPVKGMYWTWQSGYVTVKIEGVLSGSVFQYHIGGYQAPNATLQEIDVPVNKERKIEFLFDVKLFLEAIDMDTIPSVMLPGDMAKTLSERMKQCIILQ